MYPYPFFLSSFISGQNQLKLPVEIYAGVVTNDSIQASNTLSFRLSACSAVWQPFEGNLTLTHSYDNPPAYCPINRNVAADTWSGFNFAIPNLSTYSNYGFGLYKMSIDGSDQYFYLDYRDQRAVGYTQTIDIWIKYNSSTNKFYYTVSRNPENYIEITSGQLFKIWELKSQGSPLTNLFLPNYSQNSLSVTIPQTKPLLNWEAFNNFGTITKYQIEKAVVQLPSSINDASAFTCFMELPASQLSFTDLTVIPSESASPRYNNYYRLRAFNSSGNSIISDTVVTHGYFNWAASGLMVMNVNSHPKLLWTIDPVLMDTMAGFFVQRKYGTSNYVTISSLLPPTSSSYLDNSVYINEVIGGAQAYYRVIAKFSSASDQISNSVSVNTGTGSPEKKGSPSVIKYSYELENNFPNPFNPETVIKYSLAVDSKVSIKVYDLLGSELADLVNETQTTGLHRVTQR